MLVIVCIFVRQGHRPTFMSEWAGDEWQAPTGGGGSGFRGGVL